MRRNERFHHSDQSYRDRGDALVRAAPLSEPDRMAVRFFIDEVQATAHISASRRYKLSQMVLGLRRFCPADFSRMTTADAYLAVDRIVTGRSLKGSALTQNSRHDYTKTLKRFLLWMIDNDLAAERLSRAKVAKIRPPSKPRMTKTVSQIIAPSQVTAMIAACKSSRDRALIAMLYEGGFRIGEIGALTWELVAFNDWYVVVNVDAKTEAPRFIPLVMTKPYLAEYKANLGREPAPEEWVFLTRTGRPLQYRALAKQITRIAERAQIEKHITPHLFRHSRITHLLREGFPESMIKLMVWGNISTDMFATYAHLQNADILNEIAVRQGLAPREGARDPGADAKQCPRCKGIAGPTQTYCPDCAMPLSEKAAREYAQAAAVLANPAALRVIAGAIERGEITPEPPQGVPGEEIEGSR